MRTIIPKILLSVIIVFVSTSYCFSQVTFLEHTIANNFDGARDVFVIDMDGDDDMDVLAAGDAGGILSWFENDGEEDFEEHEIVDHFSGAYSVHAVDVDGDGDIDVLGAAYIIGTIAWFENDGDMDFTQHNLITNFNVACTVYGVDLDGDDDIDIVSSGRSASLIKWFENDGDEDFTEHNLAQVNDPWNIYVADVNQDDSPDVLSIDYGADETLWFENDGEADFDEHVIEDDIDGPRWVSAADIDLDGDIDIIGAGRSVDLVTWWENDGNEGFTAHTIDDEFDAPNCVFAADVDHDGDIDVFASAYQDNDIKWWENDGDEGFTDHAITLNFSGACNVYSADIDSDDDMDVFGCANTADDITWWESTLDPNANPYPSSVTIHSRIELEGNEELIDDGNIAGLHLNATNGYDENIDLIEPNHPDETYLSTYFPHPEWNELIGDEFRLDIRNANDELTDNLKTYRFIVETDQTGEQVDLTFTIGVGYSNTLGAVLYDVDDDSYQSLRDDSTYSFEAVNLPREFDLVLGDALSPELSIEYPALNQELNTNIEHELAWNITDISPIRNVAVYYSLQGENYTLIDNFNGNPGSLIWDPPDELSHDCRLMIKTFDWAGNATVAIQPFILNPANQPPGEFSLISPINGSVCSTGDTTFTWQSTTDPEGLPVIYEFHKTTDPLFGNNHEILATADTFITISNMPDDERFWWKVRAIDHPGQRTWSNEFWSFDINIPQPPQGPELGWIKHLLSDEFESAEHVYAVDLDGDYDIDVIGLARGSQPDYENSAVTWWENDGVETFTEHILREDFGVGTFVTVADADNDGDVDIFYASYDALVWLENDGNQIFTDHEFDEYNSVVCIDPEDLDRDGDIDLLFCAYDDELIWMENDGDQNYTENVIDNDPGECQWVVVVDLDNDNDIDVLVTRFDQGEDGITWYENTGNEEFTTHSFAEHLQPSCIYALDLDIDGDIDIVASDISTEIVWVENDGNEEFTENYIDRDFRVAWSVFPSDVDNDGNIDVLGASVLDDQINWWGHDGDENFTEHIITDNFDGATSVFAEDVDSDSDIDILGAAQRADEIAWWEQIYPFSLIEPDSGAIVEDETATLSWQSCTDPDPDDIITYEIFWATDSEFSENLDSSSTADTTTEIIGLMDGATYWWTVHAQDTNTEGLWAADTSSFTIDLPEAPESFSLLSPEDGSTIARDFTWLTWEETTQPDEGDSILFYSVWWATDEDFTENLDSTRVAGTTFLLEYLKDDQTYWWKVRAQDSNTDGTWSDETFSFNIEIPHLPRGPAMVFIKHSIAADFGEFMDAYAIDMDDDGDIDVLGVTGNDDDIAWWENDGNQNFTVHTIDDEFEVAYDVYAIDMDIDGDMDVIGAGRDEDEIVWWENDGNQNFTAHTIDDDENTSGYSIYAIDMDEDGDIDVLGATNASDDIFWWENDGNQNFTAHMIVEDFTLSYDVFAIDVDSDNDMDVLGTSLQLDELRWWENDGTEEFTEHSIDDQLNGAWGIYAIDMDEDGDIDLLSAARYDDDVSWWENDGDEEFTEHIIDENFDGAHSVYAVDLDADSDIDVLCTAFDNDEIAWWENDGDEEFTYHQIVNEFEAASSVFAKDIDSDGDSDVLGTTRDDEEIAWWSQDYPFSLTRPANGSIVEDSVVTLAWEECSDPDPDDVLTYEIFWATDSLLSENLDSVSTADTTFGLSDLVEGTTYWWTNHAQDTNTEGLWAADTFSFTFDLSDSPGNFSLISPGDGTTIDRDYLKLQWESTTDPDFEDEIIYVLWWATDEDFTENLDSIRTVGTIYHLENLDDDQNYWWKVRAQDRNTVGIWSDETWTFDVVLPQPPRGPSMVFADYVIRDEFRWPRSVFAIDMDDDRDIDVLGISYFGARIDWCENDGNQNFTEHRIGGAITYGESVYAIDLDSDGDIDVLGCRLHTGYIKWCENDGNQNFTDHLIDDDFDGARSVFASDLDNDGDIDVLGAGYDVEEFAWWENDGNQNFEKHTLGNDFDGASTIYAEDVDDDGDTDILGATHGNDCITWWENDGNQDFTEHTITDEFDGAISVYAIDLDSDDDIDIVGAANNDNDIAWWENDGEQDFTEHIIQDDFTGVHAIYAIDFDGDDDIDVLGTAEEADDVTWWENDGNQNFTRHNIDENFDFAWSVYAKDVDSDGDIDVLGTALGDNNNNITWWSQDYPFSLTGLDSGSIVPGATAILSWQSCTDPDPDDVVTYEIFWATDEELTENLDSVSTADSTYELTGLEDGTQLWWTVHAQDTNTEGLWAADTFSFTVDYPDPPGDFSLLSPEDGSSIPRDFTTLTWEESLEPDEGDSILFYTVYWATDENFTANMDSIRVAGTIYHLEYLRDDQTYWWKVRAQDTNSEGTWSEETWSFDVYIPEPPRGPTLIFTDHTIVDDFDGASSAYATDVDGDGDIDVLGTAWLAGDITWWENDGNENFTEHTIEGDANLPNRVYATDVDGDGDVDVLGTAWNTDAITWWENDGDENFTEHTIDGDFDGATSVYATDVDGDGDVDVLGAAWHANDIIWWENDGSENFTEHTIDGDFNGARTVYATDVDGDGDVDILGAAGQGDCITWWENDGDENFTEHTIEGDFDNAWSVYATDVDGDGDIDVLGAAEDADDITWWENDGNENFTEHTINGDFDRARSVYTIDVDGDGDIDVLGAARGPDDITWWENDGNENFTEYTIDGDFNDANSVYATDIDGDGDIDVLGAAFGDDEIAWWSQDYPFSLTEPDSGSVIEASTTPISWQSCIDPDPDDEITYEIFWATNAEFSENLDSVLTADSTFELTGLADTTTFWWTIHAQDTNTDGLWAADTFSFTTQIPSPPENFSLLSPENGSTTTSFDTILTWETSTENDLLDSVIYYSLWWATDANFTENLDSIRIAGTTYFLNDLPDNSTYYWKVRAQDTNTAGTWSDETFSFEVIIPQVPRGPTLVWKDYLIVENVNNPSDVFAADIDSDGDNDILHVDVRENEIAWWENDGDQEFTRQLITNVFEDTRVVFAYDLDCDGDMDILGASSGDTVISWFENDGDQTFTEHHITEDIGIPRDFYPVDLDGDGDVDLLAASAAEDTDITWIENDGHQNFTINVVEEDFFFARSIHPDDFDDDGDIDILGSHGGGGLEIVLWENNGEETFTEHIFDLEINADPNSLFSADLDGDGDQDFISAHREATSILWWENEGEMEFEEHTVIEEFDGAASVYSVDIDGDGDFDVLGAASVDDEIAWFENDGEADPEFTMHTIESDFDNAWVVFAKDIDSDGDYDVLGGALGDDEIKWWENSYPFTLLSPETGTEINNINVTISWEECTDPDPDDEITYEIFWATDEELTENLDSVIVTDASYELTDLVDDQSYWWTVHAQDTNTEGLWAADTFSFTIYNPEPPESFSLLSPNDGGTISRDFTTLTWEETTEPDEGDSVIFYSLWWSTDPDFSENVDSIRTVGTTYHLDFLQDDQTFWWKVRAQDINTEGTWSEETWSFTIEIPQSPRGQTLQFVEHVISDNFNVAQGVNAADIDGDDDIDIIGANDGSIYWWENDGNQDFDGHEIEFDYFTGNDISALDIDSDGDIDITSASYWGPNNDPYGVYWWENDGDQDFTEHSIAQDFEVYLSTCTADLDNDGDIDIIVGSNGNNRADDIAWWENDGNQTFAEHTIEDDMESAKGVAAIDLDDDGDIDVIGCDFNDDEIAWWENDGNQDFEEHLIDDNYRSLISAYIFDLDNDNDLDIVCGSSSSDLVTWWENNGNQQFTEHTVAENFDDPREIVAVDIDNDGDGDIVGASYRDHQVALWLNDGNQDFTEYMIRDDFTNATDVYVRDVDNDGDLDVLGTCESEGLIWWSQEYTFNLLSPPDTSILDTTVTTLTWESCTDPDPDDEITYEVFWATNAELTANLDSVTTADTTYELTGLEDDSTYWWTVHAQDTNTEGLWSIDTSSFFIGIPEPPENFSLLSPEDGSTVSRDFTTLSWEEATEPDERDSVRFYSVWWSTDPDFSEDVDSIRVAGTVYHLENLDDDQTYWWKVRAQDTNSDGTWSDEAWSFDVYIPQSPQGPELGWIKYRVGILNDAHFVYATDINGDGDIDVLGTAFLDDDIAWWENDGNEDFTRHTIGEDYNGAYSIYAIDVDGDGDIDVLGVAVVDHEITWWENDGDENFMQHTIDGDFRGARSVYAIDVDGDGDIDVLGAAVTENDITWWENDGNENFTGHTIDGEFDGARFVFAIDVDGDGDIDVLGVAANADDITWWENDGSENFTAHAIDGDFGGAHSVYATDVNGDGDIDVLGTAHTADDITWWENDGSENFTEHTIDGDFDYACAIYATDIDSDGDIDVLGAATRADDVTWWENDGNENFTEHTIDGDFDGVESVYATDVDGNGNIDILGAALGDDEIAWWSQDYPFSLLSPSDSARFDTTDVTLTWESCTDPDPDDEIVYELFWANNEELTENLDSATVVDTTFELTELINHDTYWWTVHAQDTNTEGLWSKDTSEFTITINDPPGAFSLVSPDSGGLIDDDTVTVSWTESIDPDIVDTVSYNIHWSTDPEFGEYFSGTADGTFFTITGLEDLLAGEVNEGEEDEPDGNLQLEIPGEGGIVLIRGGTGNDDNVELRDATRPGQNPGTPDNLSDTKIAEKKQGILLPDSSRSPPGNTRLIRKTSNPQRSGEETPGGLNGSLNDNGLLSPGRSRGYISPRNRGNQPGGGELDELPDDETIFWRVIASDNYGLETWSEQGESGWSFSIDISDSPEEFNLVSPARGDTAWSLDTTFTWDETTDPDPYDTPHYDVWLSLSEDMENAVLVVDSTEQATIEIVGLEDDSEYFWTVRATDSNTGGRWASDTLSFHTYSPEPPEEFNLTSPVNNDTVWSSDTTLSWEAATDPDPGDEITYLVYWATDETFTDNLDSVETTETSVDIENLLDDEVYWWKVKALDLYSLQTWSSDTYIFNTYIPDSPGEFSLVTPEDSAEVEEDTVLVQWTESIDDDPGDLITYQVEWSLDEDFENSYTDNTVDTTYFIADLEQFFTMLGDGGNYGNGRIADVAGTRKSLNVLNRSSRKTRPDHNERIENNSTSIKAGKIKPVRISRSSNLKSESAKLTGNLSFEKGINNNNQKISGRQGNRESPDELDELPDDITLFWRVKAVDRFELETWADPGEDGRTFSTYYPDPPEPFNLVSPPDGSIMDSRQVELTWRQAVDPDPEDSLTYEIYVSNDPDEWGEPVATNLADTSSVNNFADDRTYYWTIKAVDTNTEGTWADDIWTFSICASDPPSQFNLLTPEHEDTLSMLTPTLVWEQTTDPDPGDSVTYNLIWSVNDSTFANSDSATGLLIPVYTFEQGQVMAGFVDDGNESGYPVNIYSLSDKESEKIGEISIIRNKKSSRLQENSLQQFGSLSPEKNIPDQKRVPSGGDELDEDLVDDATVYWYVRAVDTNTDGRLSNQNPVDGELQLFSVYLADLPGAFSLLSPPDSSTVWGGDTTLTWARAVDPDPDDSINYIIWLATSPNFDENLDTLLTASTNIEISDLMDDSQYWWKIHARDNNSEGTWSDNIMSFNVYIPEISSDFRLIRPSSGGPLEPGIIEFTWSNSIDPDPDDSVDYTIYFWDGDRIESYSTGADTLISVNPDTIEILDYYWETIWYVAAHSNIPDTSIESDTKNYFIPLHQLTENEVIIPKHFILFPSHPNPFNNSTTIRFGLPVDTDISVNVYNLEGKLVKEIINDRLRAGYHLVQWNTGNEASGIYFVRMETDKYINTQKMLLIK